MGYCWPLTVILTDADNRFQFLYQHDSEVVSQFLPQLQRYMQKRHHDDGTLSIWLVKD